jgi:hypothetical protein
MREGGRWPPWIGCTLVVSQWKNQFFYYSCVVFPTFEFGLSWIWGLSFFRSNLVCCLGLWPESSFGLVFNSREQWLRRLEPLDSSRFADLWGKIVVYRHREIVGALSCILVLFAFLLHFRHTHLSHLASHVILTCICLIMLISVLGWVVMRCELFFYTMLDNLWCLHYWAYAKTWQLN